MSTLDEKTYRKMVSDAFERILKVFDSVDPDVAEAELGQGTLTILARGQKLILSPQPPVRQIWLAAAALGRAVHFSWNESAKKWLDDKGQGLELFRYTEEVLEKTAGQRISLAGL
jgi:CyaY protein